MLQVTPDGTVYAFVVGADLIQAAEPGLSWQTISKDGFGGDYVLYFAVDPTSHNKLHAITFNPESKARAVLASNDTGKAWSPLSGPLN